MICAEDELGLGNSHDGIIVLPDQTEVGTRASDIYQVERDTVFEIGLTPNRVDAASHIGVARDLAAYLKQNSETELNLPSVEEFKIDHTDNPVKVVVENQEACPRYSGITVSGIDVKESPVWLKNKLKAIGLNPINNVVDITNFILHESGQPLHAFDMAEISGKKVVVKTMPDQTPFTTLDEEERKLSSEDLMICNEKEGMCIAGVFGGIKSGVTEDTKDVFIESAYFNPVWVRKTAKRHTLSTDSSFRFERGTDPNNTLYALKRAAILIKELAGGQISSGIVDIYPDPIRDFEIELNYSNVHRLIGKDITPEKIKSILTALDIKILHESNDGLQVAVPPYRVDVQREADLVEEILRIYGYNNVEVPEQIHSNLSYTAKPDEESLTNQISDFLTANGFNEIMCNSLTKSSYYDKLNTYPADHLAMILNPLSSDLDSMRQTLLFGGLETVLYNRNRQQNELKLYEFGNVYFKNPENKSENPLDKYSEFKKLSLTISGNKEPINWNNPKSEKADFYYIKSIISRLLCSLGINESLLQSQESNNELFSYGMGYTINNNLLAEFGSVHDDILEQFEIETDVFYADINWQVLLNEVKKVQIKHRELPKFPEVRRDLALLLDKETKFEDVKNLAYKTEKKLLKNVTLFDVYQGKNIEEGKKSYGVGFVLQDENKTLTDKQIDKVMKNLQKQYEEKLSASIR
jgi:phenylalanyl-tRNA synthetase beta chain